MSYRLKRDEKLSDGIRRIAGRQAEGIGECLAHGSRQSNAIHDARTHIKKLRALARLVREQLGEKSYSKCNDILKGIAKSLSPSRDAHVRLRTLDRLKAAHPESSLRHPKLRTLLTNARESKLHANSRLADWQKREVRRLKEMIGTWEFNGLRKKTLKKGIAHSRRRLRNSFKTAKETPTVENLHAWRKATKDLMNQMAVVEKVEQVSDKQMAILEKLGKYLGDDHDLAMFEAKAGELFLPVLKPIRKLVHKRREALQKTSFQLGRKLKSV